MDNKTKIYGVDMGTMFFQVAELDECDKKTVKVKTTRNAFVELASSEDVDEVLEKNDWQYVQDGNKYYIIGEDSLKVANMFPGKVELRRPLQDGVLNKNEEKKMLILSHLISSSIGNSPNKQSIVCTCVSSESVDGSVDNAFHKARLMGIFKNLGWNVKVIEEGLAVILSERPVMKEPDGTESPYSGIGISCLLPHVKIYTKRGIIPISDVKVGDMVLTHKNRWRSIFNIVKKDFNGIATKLQMQGYSDNTEEYAFVDDHEIYVYRDSEWQWIGCESIQKGDIVGEPIVSEDVEEKYNIGMAICERVTNSSKYTKKRVEVTSDVQRLIGYFLGDGSISRLSNTGICFDFGPDEKFYAEDVAAILEKNFDKKSEIKLVDWDGSLKLHVSCYSKGLARYFRNHFYNDDGEKEYPWCLSKLRKTHCLNLLVGLIRSDGDISSGINFSNTSTSLIFLVKQLFARLGYSSSISWRLPRSSKLKNGRIISGKKNSWAVNVGSKLVSNSLKDIILSLDCSSSRFNENMFINNSFACSTIQEVEYDEYSGPVYDLQVEEDHSFSGPFLTIHNCGAGRTNCVLAYKGLSVIGMSCARSGDWVDRKVAEATGEPVGQVTRKKEMKLNFKDIDYDDDVIFALDAYYGEMIKFVFNNFARKFAEVKSQFESPLDIVIAGGTSMPQGFCDKIKEVIREMDLPFAIKDVRHASTPCESVVKGCLTQAIATYRRMIKSDPNDIASALG